MSFTPHALRIGPYPWDSGAASGTKSIILTYEPPLDLSWKRQILAILTVTTADTDAADILTGSLQFTQDGTIWNTVGTWEPILGTASPSGTAPEIRHLQLQQHIVLDTPEEAYEPTGSAGAAAIATNSIRQCLFPGRVYSGGRMIPGFRVVLSITDVDVDARFAGSVDLWIS